MKSVSRIEFPNASTVDASFVTIHSSKTKLTIHDSAKYILIKSLRTDYEYKHKIRKLRLKHTNLNTYIFFHKTKTIFINKQLETMCLSLIILRERCVHGYRLHNDIYSGPNVYVRLYTIYMCESVH